MHVSEWSWVGRWTIFKNKKELKSAKLGFKWKKTQFVKKLLKDRGLLSKIKNQSGKLNHGDCLLEICWECFDFSSKYPSNI